MSDCVALGCSRLSTSLGRANTAKHKQGLLLAGQIFTHLWLLHHKSQQMQINMIRLSEAPSALGFGLEFQNFFCWFALWKHVCTNVYDGMVHLRSCEQVRNVDLDQWDLRKFSFRNGSYFYLILFLWPPGGDNLRHLKFCQHVIHFQWVTRIRMQIPFISTAICQCLSGRNFR